MKREMRAFDVLAVVNEMQPLVGGYIDKIFQWDGNNVLIRVNTRNGGKAELFFRDGRWLYLTPERPDLPDFPEPFAVHLRKNLTNARITSIKQVEFDRLVMIDLYRGEDYRLVIELFGDGNLLLVKEGKILNCLSSRRWRHREIRPGADYVLPPSKFNPIEADLEKFLEAARNSTTDIVRTLATVINLGGQYAEEICLRAGIEKNRKMADLSDSDLEGVFNALKDLINEINTDPKPVIVFRGEEAVDVTPVPLKQYEGRRVEEYPTFSVALFNYLQGEMEAGEDAALEKLIRQLERQRESVTQRIREADELTATAESLYMHYQEVNGLLSSIREISKQTGWEGLRSYAGNVKIIKKLDPATHSVTLLIDGREVTLDYELNIDANANMLYQRAKDLREKARRAEEALRETEAKIEERKRGLEKEKIQERVRPTKQFWFERYKWFITTGGRLVLAGRDAKTNDQLVKKHLKPEDRYAHADIHGAPSVIIKGGSEAGEEELREACIFALCHSKAWNAGVREGSAYWVLPDQVSKQPQAGEFVPRGAFIIRGKRNYFHHLPLELGVGEIEYQGERKIMCAPRQTAESMCQRVVMITPGKMKRNEFSSLLARIFRVPEEEISRILPPGDVEVIDQRGVEIEK